MFAGMRQYCERYGETIYNVTQTFGPPPRWKGATRDRVVADLDARFPLDRLPDHRRWRDRRLEALSKLKREQDAEAEAKKED